MRLAYDKETLSGWRAIRAIGMAARAIVHEEQAFLRETIRKLLWSLSDESGGIGWSAPEIIGEIICSDPEGFKDIIPIVSGIYDIEEEVFRPGIVYALSRIAEQRPDLVALQKDVVLRALTDKDVLVRYFAIQTVKKIRSVMSGNDLDYVTSCMTSLKSDMAEAWVYKDDDFVCIQIAEEASGI